MPSDDEYEEFRAWREWRRAREQAPSRRERTVIALWDAYAGTLDPNTGIGKMRPGFRKFLGYPPPAGCRPEQLVTFYWNGQQTRMGDLVPSQIDEIVFKTWVRAIYDTRTNRGESPTPGRVENVRVALQACFTFHRRELGGENPLQSFDKQPGWNRKRLGYFTADKLEEWCAALPPMTSDIFRVLFITLQRESTIRCLKKSHVDWDERDLLLTVKGGREVRLPCADEAFEILRRWAAVSRSDYIFPNPRDPKGKPLPYPTFRKQQLKAEKATGIRLRAHAARHGGARHLLPTTALPLISHQLAHRDLKTTGIYLGVSQQLHEVLRKSMNDAAKRAK
jgi:integrase